MRATVLHGIEDLKVEDWPEVELGSGEVRVRIAAGGICGSDLHYFRHYRMGNYPVLEPFVPGHEISGRIAEVGPGVSGLSEGDPVAINPSRPCGACDFCLNGRELLCTDMKFLGSSRRTPHVQGGFAETFVTEARQCVPVPGDLPLSVAAFAEPLSVALHAVNRAGPILGARVLVSGAGPIGCLVGMAARLSGAARVTIADVVDQTLERARLAGLDDVVNVSKGDGALVDASQSSGGFDVAFEASGAPTAVLSAIRTLKPGGTLVQVGTFVDPMVPVPTDLIMTKELRLLGSFRFDREFDWAVDYLSSGRIDVTPLLSHSFDIGDATEAFQIAGDRTQAMKVQITFS
ncbi:MAG: L-idonate 5-dehydrogenase [Rhodospirillaceae bacterium]|nr:L-idonate 5-dehydrogenase [Rhodospirillaceae bacterium]